jgi:hypothetical protein
MKTKNIVWSWRDDRFGVVIIAIPFLFIITGYVDEGFLLLVRSIIGVVSSDGPSQVYAHLFYRNL